MIGCDPEIIPVDITGKARSIIGKLGGSKEKPIPVEYGAFQEDNVNAEFNIVPASTFEEFDRNICRVMSQLQEAMAEHELIISTLASAIFPEEDLFGPALVAGCSPDFNAWEMDFNSPPYLRNSALRSAGGHIHFSWEGFDGYKTPPERHKDFFSAHFQPRTQGQDALVGFNLVRCLDYRLGVQSVLFDLDTERKKLYGQAGCFRPKEYGIEYRTLSNFWIFDRDLRHWAWKESEWCLNNYEKFIIEPDSSLGEDIVRCINTNDKHLAQQIMENY